MEDTLYSKIYSTPFFERFSFNIKMLNYRTHRLFSIDTTNKDNLQEYQMVFDATLVLFRSMFLEKGSSNYTYQNYFRNTGKSEVADRIDDLLDSKFYSYSDISIRTVLKFIADKFVCHQDSVCNTDIGLMQAYMSNLSNPYFDNNFQNIISRICSIMN